MLGLIKISYQPRCSYHLLYWLCWQGDNWQYFLFKNFALLSFYNLAVWIRHSTQCETLFAPNHACVIPVLVSTYRSRSSLGPLLSCELGPSALHCTAERYDLSEVEVPRVALEKNLQNFRHKR